LCRFGRPDLDIDKRLLQLECAFLDQFAACRCPVRPRFATE
jgi:hypothetical protein